MKIDREKAVAFLTALAFPKASTWDDEKLVSRLAKVTDKVKEEEVPKGFGDLYSDLLAMDGEKIELVAPKKPAVKKAVENVTVTKTKNKAAKVEAKLPPKKEKPADATSVERDEFGSKVGSISAKVNSALETDWKDEETIAEEAKVTLDQARGRLYYAQQEGVIEVRRLVQYRVVKKK